MKTLVSCFLCFFFGVAYMFCWALGFPYFQRYLHILLPDFSLLFLINVVFLFMLLCFFVLIGLLFLPMFIRCFYKKNKMMHSDYSFKNLELGEELAVYLNENPLLFVQVLTRWLMQSDSSFDQKAGVIVATLSAENQKKIYKLMNKNQVVKIKQIIHHLDEGEKIENQEIINNFLISLQNPHTPQISQMIDEKIVWKKIEKMPIPALTSFLKTQNMQKIVLILYHLSEEKSSQLLSKLPADLSVNCMIKLASLKSIQSDKIADLEFNLEKSLFLKKQAINLNGYEKALLILNKMTGQNKTHLINLLKAKSPQMAKKLSKELICFDDIALLSDDDICLIIKSVSFDILAQALSIANDKTKEAFAKNLSPMLWSKIILNKFDIQGFHIYQLEQAQCQLIKKTQEFIDKGKIKRVS